MKGYIADSGSYITGKEVERRKRARIEEIKELRKQKEERLKKEEEYKMVLYMQEKKERQEQEEARKELINNKVEFINNIGSYNLPYNQFMIAYDIMNNNNYQIEADYKKGKINKEDILKVLNIIPSNIMTDYQKDLLIAL